MSTRTCQIVYIHGTKSITGEEVINEKIIIAKLSAVQTLGKKYTEKSPFNPNMQDHYILPMNCTVEVKDVANQKVICKDTLKGAQAYGYCYPDDKKLLLQNIKECLKGQQNLFSY